MNGYQEQLCALSYMLMLTGSRGCCLQTGLQQKVIESNNLYLYIWYLSWSTFITIKFLLIPHFKTIGYTINSICSIHIIIGLHHCVSTCCVTIDCAVFSPNNVSIRLHLLVVWELQVDGEGDFGCSQSWGIVPNVERNSSTWMKKTGRHRVWGDDAPWWPRPCHQFKVNYLSVLKILICDNANNFSTDTFPGVFVSWVSIFPDRVHLSVPWRIASETVFGLWNTKRECIIQQNELVMALEFPKHFLRRTF